ncbi:MAG: SMC-Scp complex subunit ScpB [Candidatus Thermoplasmatota archaeon]
MGKKEKRLVESVLFSATQPVSINKIKESTGISRKKVKETIDDLVEEYNVKRKDDISMEVVKAGDKYIMQLKEEYSPETTTVSDPEIDESLLKTLSLIALHQPIKQSNLRRMVGTKAYDHVDELVSKRLVYARKYRNTEMLTTTKRFPEYFGIDSTKPKEIRNFLMEKVVNKMQGNNKEE